MRGLPFSPAAPNPPAAEYGDEVAVARRVLAQHRRQRYPYGRCCGWCRQTYPCPPRRAAEHLLVTTGTTVATKPGVATVPGLSSRQLRDPSTVSQAQLLMMGTGH